MQTCPVLGLRSPEPDPDPNPRLATAGRMGSTLALAHIRVVMIPGSESIPEQGLHNVSEIYDFDSGIGTTQCFRKL